MSCCYPVDCCEYQVTPVLVAPCEPIPCCEDLPLCYPCVPRCQKIYCCKPKCPPRTPPQTPPPEPCCEMICCHQYCPPPPCPRMKPCPPSPPPTRKQSRTSAPESCPNLECCHIPCCKPVKTKYVIPCYRYEDGRIEKYEPVRHGRLPMSAYRRNGMQDQMYGYRGAIRYLCSKPGCPACSLHTIVEPLKRLYPKITQEMYAVKKKKKVESICN